MIQIPENEVQVNDFEKVVREVLTQLQTGKVSMEKVLLVPPILIGE